MKNKFKIGDKVKVTKDNDNKNYNKFRNKVLVINHIAKNIKEHRGFDEGMNQPLYSFKGIKFSLYEYELRGLEE